MPDSVPVEKALSLFLQAVFSAGRENCRRSLSKTHGKTTRLFKNAKKTEKLRVSL